MSSPLDAETVLDFTQGKVVVLDDRGRYRYLNAAVRDLLGFGPEELVGESAFELVHPEDEPDVRALFEEFVAGERDATETVEYRYGTADGDWLWMRSVIHAPADTGLDGYVLSSRDVTEEVESRRRLETIVSTSPDVLWMFDPEWSELLFVNDAVSDVFGIDPETLERRPQRFLDRVHSAHRPNVRRTMERISAGESTTIDYRVESEPSEVRWVRVPGQPVYEGDAVVAVAGFARDVTDEYRRKRQLEVMDNLLRHTIRNDMNVVIGTAERIIDSIDAARSERNAPATMAAGADLKRDAETIRRVAEDLLDTAEKQRDVIGLLSRGGSPRPIDVEPIVRESLAAARPDGSTGEFSMSCPSGVTAFAIPELEDAIAELVENAVEHAETAPAIEVVVACDDAVVEITVRDNCPPIPPEERHIIADRWRMDDLHHTVGMGLWLAYWVADRSGGDLSFDTHTGGNVVTLRVPNDDAGIRADRVV